VRLVEGNARSGGGEQWAITRNLDDETITAATHRDIPRTRVRNLSPYWLPLPSGSDVRAIPRSTGRDPRAG
jgi:hypothetical protein